MSVYDNVCFLLCKNMKKHFNFITKSWGEHDGLNKKKIRPPVHTPQRRHSVLQSLHLNEETSCVALSVSGLQLARCVWRNINNTHMSAHVATVFSYQIID
jgi:hypothetical protein